MRVLVNPTELSARRMKDELGNDCLLFLDGEQIVAKGMFVYDSAGLVRFELRSELAASVGQPELIASVKQPELERLLSAQREDLVTEMLTQMLEAVRIENVTVKLDESN